MSSTMRQRPTIFVDCTRTERTKFNTGVERVVRNIISCPEEIYSELGYRKISVGLVVGRFREVATQQVALSAGTRLARRRKKVVRRARQLKGKLQNAIEYVLSTGQLFAEHLGGKGIFQSYLNRISNSAAEFQVYGVAGDHLKGSILILADTHWSSELRAAVLHLKDQGCKVVCIVYDLIPLTHPETTAGHTEEFEKWFRESTRYADGYICISKFVANEVCEYLKKDGTSEAFFSSNVRSFYLGSDFQQRQSFGSASTQVVSIFSSANNVFLMVGSIEPRKSHEYVLNAFESLWAAEINVSLVFVGRNTWKSDALLERISSHQRLNQNLFLLRDATDVDLDFCYNHSSALIIASTVEGFGLPIVEAFQAGLPVIASDIPVFREIAKDNATYFLLDNTESLAGVVKNFCKSAPSRHRIPWIDWNESVASLIREAQHIGNNANILQRKSGSN